MELSFIIVTYNCAEFINDCLKSIKKNVKIHHEIIVVDNNSSDNTLDVIHRSGIKVNLIGQKDNLGFTKANNLGAKKAGGKYLFFLNPDTEVLGSIDEMFDYIGDSGVGVVAPKLIMSDGKPQPSVRNLPTVWGAIREYLLDKRNAYEAYIPQSLKAVEVESVVGAAMLIRKGLFEKVGGFDEKYFMYFEDLDLCRKVKKLGLKIIYLPNVFIRHAIGPSARTNPKTGQILIESSRMYHGLINSTTLFFVLRIFLRVKIRLRQLINLKDLSEGIK